jgi:hypothetical protein
MTVITTTLQFGNDEGYIMRGNIHWMPARITKFAFESLALHQSFTSLGIHDNQGISSSS